MHAAAIRETGTETEQGLFIDVNELEWLPWAMRGMYFKLLSVDPDTGRFTLLLKVDAGITAPLHRHHGAVEVYVLGGAFHYHDEPHRIFRSGSYLLEPSASVHQPLSPQGAVILAVFHGPVEGILPDGGSAGSIDWKWHVDVWNARPGAC